MLVEERTRVIQRLDKTLQDAGIKLTSVASSLLTKSGRMPDWAMRRHSREHQTRRLVHQLEALGLRVQLTDAA